MKKTLKVGDKVIYRCRWGEDLPKETIIENIELCNEEGEKYGDVVNEMTEDNYKRCCLDLADKHWCYGYQIDWEDSIKLNN